MSESLFEQVQLAPSDVIFGLVADFKADPHPDKLSLIVGAYRTEEGEPYVLPVVRKVESQIAADTTLNHEYLPISGLQDLCDGAVRLALGPDHLAITENRVAAVQTLSGTGALRLAFDFLLKHYPNHTVFIPKPTWGNHKQILSFSGYTDVREYTYYDPKTKGLNLEGMLKDLEAAPNGSIVLLHACAQNPCGVDLSRDEWNSVSELCKEKRFMIVFDMAYQGFVSGYPHEDAWPVQHFAMEGHEIFVCQSFAKVFGLYNERCGNLFLICRTSEIALNVMSQLKRIIRAMYSNPPHHGARVVATILNNPTLKNEWLAQLKAMTDRILMCREMLLRKLKELEVPGDWSHITSQKGMFTFTGLRADQVLTLREKYHIYLLSSGRINVCAINKKNVDYIARAIKDVVVGAKNLP